MKSEALENEILQGLVGSDPKYQEVLYKRFYSYGMSICLRYTARREEALEILHDGFMALFTHPERYDQSRPFQPWFRRVLINLCINHFKKHQKEIVETGLDYPVDSLDPSPGVLEELDYSDLIRAIQKLPDAYRTVFNLFVIEGFSHEEIAEMLGIQTGTSKSNLARARMKLREMLNPKSHEQEIFRYG